MKKKFIIFIVMAAATVFLWFPIISQCSKQTTKIEVFQNERVKEKWKKVHPNAIIIRELDDVIEYKE